MLKWSLRDAYVELIVQEGIQSRFIWCSLLSIVN